MTALTDLLVEHTPCALVLPELARDPAPLVFDFSSANTDLARLDLSDTPAFSAWVDHAMAAAGVTVAVGRYGEDRVVYRHSPLFDGDVERRSVHLGIDLFAPAGTPLHCPLDATVHSLADNARLGDYGPTVVLEHRLGDTTFWTLWGHLSRASLPPLAVGRIVRAGETVASLGRPDENGGWPPHLHFQVVTEIGHHRGDYPGVAAPSEREAWLERCPDPSPLLGIPGLD